MSFKKIVAGILFILPLWGYCQFTYLNDQYTIVQDQNGNILSQPWAGGLNAAQFNRMDLNGDGIEDLVLFDRTAKPGVDARIINLLLIFRYKIFSTLGTSVLCLPRNKLPSKIT